MATDEWPHRSNGRDGKSTMQQLEGRFEETSVPGKGSAVAGVAPRSHAGDSVVLSVLSRATVANRFWTKGLGFMLKQKSLMESENLQFRIRDY